MHSDILITAQNQEPEKACAYGLDRVRDSGPIKVQNQLLTIPAMIEKLLFRDRQLSEIAE